MLEWADLTKIAILVFGSLATAGGLVIGVLTFATNRLDKRFETQKLWIEEVVKRLDERFDNIETHFAKREDLSNLRADMGSYLKGISNGRS